MRNENRKNIVIYALANKQTPENYFYCGQSWDKIMRLNGHIDEAKKNCKCHKCCTIRLIGYENITSTIIQICETYKEADEREIYWIAELKKQGHKLTNISEGGYGIRGYKHREDTKKLIGFHSKEHWKNPEYREKKIKGMKEEKKNYVPHITTLKAAWNANRGRKRESWELASIRGVPHTEERKKYAASEEKEYWKQNRGTEKMKQRLKNLSAGMAKYRKNNPEKIKQTMLKVNTIRAINSRMKILPQLYSSIEKKLKRIIEVRLIISKLQN